MIRFAGLLFILCLPASVLPAQAQRKGWLQTENDTSYITDLTEELTVRLYGSRKFTNYLLADRHNGRRLYYRPNSPFNLGFGFNHKFLGLNIGFNFPFINTYDKYGKTRFLDLQSHVYLRKIVIDFYAQYYKGYYLVNTGALSDNHAGMVYLRPDMGTWNGGLSVQYIFNDERFSFRAAYLQNEYQKKSAGSLMVGGDLHTVAVRADSSVIPANIVHFNFFDNNHFNRSNIYCGTVNAGYAHTFVVKKHFFLMLSAHGGIGLNYTVLENLALSEREQGLHGQLNTTWRIAAGYNSETYFAGVHYVTLLMSSTAPITGTAQEFAAGNLRVSLARRFKLHKPLVRGL
jgi:hypothetical protein